MKILAWLLILLGMLALAGYMFFLRGSYNILVMASFLLFSCVGIILLSIAPRKQPAQTPLTNHDKQEQQIPAREELPKSEAPGHPVAAASISLEVEQLNPSAPPVASDIPEEEASAVTISPNSVMLGKSQESGRTIPLSQAARRQGTYMIGVNGTGKSTLIANLIVQDIEQGLGVCLLDPHGDLTKDMLSRVPEERLGDVILLDLMDSGFPFGLNLFACPNNQDVNEVATTAGFVMHVFEKVWGVGTETPQLSQVLRNVSVTLIANPGTTFNEIPLLLQDETVRGKLTGNVTNNQVKLFWTTYNRLRPVDQLERTSSTLNKVDAFLTQPIIANIVGQSHTTIDFRKIMDEGKILLVQLTPQLEDISSLVGSVIIGQLLSAALSRKDVPEEERKQFNLYADEFQRFATEDFATLLSEARKFGIATTIAHQTRSQLDLKNKGASLNAAIKIVFRVTGEDGKELAREFERTPDVILIGDEPVRAVSQEACKHLLEKGHPNPQAMAFNRMLMILQEFAGIKIDHNLYTSSDGSMVWRARRAYAKDIHLHDSVKVCIRMLNEYFAVVQTTGNPNIPPPPLALDTIDRLMRHLKGNLPYMDMLHETVEVLATEPIMVDTGQYRPKYQQRTYADMEGEMASTLTNLPNFQARIKTVKGETAIVTQPPVTGLTGQAFEDRREQVISQTRAAYCRPAPEVEQEIAERQAALIEKEEKVQGRREEVEAGKQDGQGQPFRPSRRHKEPPKN